MNNKTPPTRSVDKQTIRAMVFVPSPPIVSFDLSLGTPSMKTNFSFEPILVVLSPDVVLDSWSSET